MYVSLITGHNDLAYHTSLREGDTYGACGFCNTEMETFYHLFAECPVVLSVRVEISRRWISREQDDWRVDQVMAFAMHPRINELVAYDMNDSWDLDQVEDPRSREDV